MTQVKKGQFIILDPKSVDMSGLQGQGKKDDKDKPSSPTELETPPTDVEKPEFDPNAETGPGYERTLTGKTGVSVKTYKSKKALGEGGTKAELTDYWNKALSRALSSGAKQLSDKAKRLLMEMTSNKPKVNWKKELKKFFDQAFNQYEEVLPSRRHIGRGDVLYGRKKVGSDTLKKLVVAVDTSGSISKAQIKVFFEEVWSLATKYDMDETIIIYCSDDIDAIDVVKKGKKPDLSKYASTGGNAKGFAPPFAYLQKEKIKPSAVIYLTDSFAEYPRVDQYGIDKYKQKVFWFICNATKQFDKPPFGRYIHVPMDQKGNFL
jgi:predicted metal-dependent peptidase